MYIRQSVPTNRIADAEATLTAILSHVRGVRGVRSNAQFSATGHLVLKLYMSRNVGERETVSVSVKALYEVDIVLCQR